MCAYFFSAKHNPNDFQLEQDDIGIMNMIASPLFKKISKDLPASYQYNSSSQTHTNIIKELTNAARNKLLDVKAIDKEISVAFSLGVVASLSSFIPFNWLIMPMAFIYTGYLAKERDAAYAEYTVSLAALRLCCDWAVNNESSTQGDMDLAHVKSMLNLLSQVMTKKQLGGVIRDELEKTFFDTINITDEVKKDTLDYKIYGYDQGGSISAILTEVGSYMKRLLTKAATDTMVYLNTPVATR